MGGKEETWPLVPYPCAAGKHALVEARQLMFGLPPCSEGMLLLRYCRGAAVALQWRCRGGVAVCCRAAAVMASAQPGRQRAAQGVAMRRRPVRKVNPQFKPVGGGLCLV